jgi:hypothetical protein
LFPLLQRANVVDLLALSQLLHDHDAYAAAHAAGGGAGGDGGALVAPGVASQGRGSCAVVNFDGQVQVVVHPELASFLDKTVGVQAALKRFKQLQVSLHMHTYCSL